MGSELPWLTGSGPLSWIETFVTFCGIVWLRAKVLGQMGWTTSPYLRAGALSCPSLAIEGPGSYGAPAFILPLAALCPNLLERSLRFAPPVRCAGPRVV